MQVISRGALALPGAAAVLAAPAPAPLTPDLGLAFRCLGTLGRPSLSTSSATCWLWESPCEPLGSPGAAAAAWALPTGLLQGILETWEWPMAARLQRRSSMATGKTTVLPGCTAEVVHGWRPPGDQQAALSLTLLHHKAQYALLGIGGTPAQPHASARIATPGSNKQMPLNALHYPVCLLECEPVANLSALQISS